MTEPSPNKSRPAHDQVLSILDDLDSFAPIPTSGTNPSTTTNQKNSASSSTLKTPQINTSSSIPNQATSVPSSATKPDDAQSVLDFIDEITQRSSTPTVSIKTKKLTETPASRSISRKPSGASVGRRSIDSRTNEPEPTSAPSPAPSPIITSSWGWGSVLKQATSSVLSQAKSAAGQVQSVVADPSKSSELVKNFNSNLQHQLSGQSEAAKKWKDGVISYVKASGIDQLGKDLQATGIKSISDIINMVAPPISKHEIISVQLSYDMVGYDGIENLVYQTLSKVMEQVDGGELILNKGDEERAKTPESGAPERDLQEVEGMVEGYKLALANLEQMIKRLENKNAESATKPDEATSESGGNAQLPITHCPVYLRIQPILSRLPVFPSSSSVPPVSTTDQAKGGIKVDEEKHLFFLILLRDVKNSLDHATLTQSLPAIWLDIPFEENEWVEDVMVEIIKRGVETIGQQYVNGRVNGRSVRNATTDEALTNATQPETTQQSAE